MEVTRVLVVDDDASVRQMLTDYLSAHGYEVRQAASGAAMRAELARALPAVVLLDIGLPGEDGLTLARYLRQETTAAIIMLTAAAEVVDRVIGLELGADDYIAKPFDAREVIARIKSVLRRAVPAGPQPAAPPAPALPEQIRFGRFVLNLASHQLFGDDGTQVPLTSMEFDLLKALGTHPGRALNRDQILDLAHSREWEPFDRSIDIRIARIRRKIEVDATQPRLIRTVRGVGYMFVPDPG